MDGTGINQKSDHPTIPTLRTCITLLHQHGEYPLDPSCSFSRRPPPAYTHTNPNPPNPPHIRKPTKHSHNVNTIQFNTCSSRALPFPRLLASPSPCLPYAVYCHISITGRPTAVFNRRTCIPLHDISSFRSPIKPFNQQTATARYLHRDKRSLFVSPQVSTTLL